MKARLGIFPVVFGIGILVSVVASTLDLGAVARYVFYACAAGPAIWAGLFVAFRSARPTLREPASATARTTGLQLDEPVFYGHFSHGGAIGAFGVLQDSEVLHEKQEFRHRALPVAPRPPEWLAKVAALVFMGLAIWGAVAGNSVVLIGGSTLVAAILVARLLTPLYLKVSNLQKPTDAPEHGEGTPGALEQRRAKVHQRRVEVMISFVFGVAVAAADLLIRLLGR